MSLGKWDWDVYLQLMALTELEEANIIKQWILIAYRALALSFALGALVVVGIAQFHEFWFPIRRTTRKRSRLVTCFFLLDMTVSLNVLGGNVSESIDDSKGKEGMGTSEQTDCGWEIPVSSCHEVLEWPLENFICYFEGRTYQLRRDQDILSLHDTGVKRSEWHGGVQQEKRQCQEVSAMVSWFGDHSGWHKLASSG